MTAPSSCAATADRTLSILSDPDRSSGGTEAAIDALRRILSPYRVIETHMAFVLLTGDRAYKLRKSIRTADVDYTDAAARRASCHTEVALNRELSSDVYLDVLAMNLAHDGKLTLRGAGPEIDWVIVMRRLPDDLLLDRMLMRGLTVPHHALAALSKVLAGFYARHSMPPDEAPIFFERLRDTTARNRASLARWDDLVAAGALTLSERASALLEASRAEIEARISQGLIVDGHGDLRPEHVCLEARPIVFDRIEFSRALRLVDVHEEVGYLAMECDLASNDGPGPDLLDCITRRGFPAPSAGLQAAYLGLRCLTRARLCMDHLLEVEVRKAEKWRPLSHRYIARARVELDRVT
jgi:aminoglycoside phosphotransferase family enzyme